MRSNSASAFLAALLVAAACVKKPASTRRPADADPGNTPRDGTLDARTEPVPVFTDAPPSGTVEDPPAPPADPPTGTSDDPSDVPVVGASPVASPTDNDAPVAKPSATPPTRSLTVVTSFPLPGGWFRSCVSVRVKNAPNANWIWLGCTKPEPANASACVGPEVSFNGRVTTLPLPVTGKALVTVRVQTFHQTEACAGKTTFRYPPSTTTDASLTWSLSTEQSTRRDRFRCRKTADKEGATVAAVRYEDTKPVVASGTDGFKDLTVGFVAKGLDLDVEGFEGACAD